MPASIFHPTTTTEPTVTDQDGLRASDGERDQATKVLQQAMVDGCTRPGAFVRITLPLLLPGIAAVFAYAFIWTWGDMLFPLILAKNLDHQTAALSLFITMQSTRGATNYGGLLAAGVLFTIPATVLFLLLQRPVIEGLTGGALKE